MALNGIPISNYQEIGDSLPVLNNSFVSLDTRLESTSSTFYLTIDTLSSLQSNAVLLSSSLHSKVKELSTSADLSFQALSSLNTDISTLTSSFVNIIDPLSSASTLAILTLPLSAKANISHIHTYGQTNTNAIGLAAATHTHAQSSISDFYKRGFTFQENSLSGIVNIDVLNNTSFVSLGFGYGPLYFNIRGNNTTALSSVLNVGESTEVSVVNTYYPTYKIGTFNGTTYLSADYNPSFDLGASNFSIEAWVNLSNVTAQAVLISMWNATGTANSNQWMFYVQNGLPTFVYSLNGQSVAGTATGPAVTVNTWTHVAVQRSGDRYTVYTNGIPSNTTTLTSGSYFLNNEPLAIGYVRNNAANYTTIAGRFTGSVYNLTLRLNQFVFSTPITTPSTKFLADANTSLLAFQSRDTYLDESFTSNTLTINNPPATVSQRTRYISTTNYDGVVACGGTFTLFQDMATTRVNGCGNNEFNQLAFFGSSLLKSAISVRYPTLSYNVETTKKVVCGLNCTFFIYEDDTVWAVGENLYGQLGIGTGEYVTTPTYVTSNVKDVACGDGFTLFLKRDGTVWGSGNNGSGQLGLGTLISTYSPTKITSFANKIIEIAAGGTHSLFVDELGQAWACGNNTFRQLGDQTTTSRNTPVQVWQAGVGFLTGVTKIAAGGIHSLFLKSDGSVFGCGFNQNGELGLGDNLPKNSATYIFGDTSNPVTFIAAGDGFSLFSKSDYTIWGCGNNNHGQLGDGTTINKNIPSQAFINISGTEDVVEISGIHTSWAARHSVITGRVSGSRFTVRPTRSTVRMWTCGENTYGQLGDGTTVDKYTPIVLGDITASVAILPKIVATGGLSPSVFYFFSDIILSNGYASLGQRGNPNHNTNINYTPFVPVELKNVTHIEASFSGESTWFFRSDGTIWACGNNIHNTLNVDSSSTDYFRQILLTEVISIKGGDDYSLFLKNNGTVWSCGYNNRGQLGLGNTTTTTTPTQISTLTGITKIAAGFSHSLFLKNDGTVWACGYNLYGWLGDGTTTQRTTPVQVLSLTGIVDIVAGQYNSYFLKNDGTVWVCGYNNFGQLGLNLSLTSFRSTPTQIPTLTGITKISIGGGSNPLVVFLKNDGTVWGCGFNAGAVLYGAGGAASTYAVPIQVSLPPNIIDVAAHAYNLICATSNDYYVRGNIEYGLGQTSVTSYSPYYNQVFFCPLQQFKMYTSLYNISLAANQYVSVANNAAFTMGTGNFTVECFWTTPTTFGTSGSQYIWCLGMANGTNTGLLLHAPFNGNLRLTSAGAVLGTSTIACAPSTVYHLAVVRNGTNLRLYIDGNIAISVTNSTNFTSNASNGFTVGADIQPTVVNSAQPQSFSQVRVVKGQAVYTFSSFTPPVTPSSLRVSTVGELTILQRSTPFVDFSTSPKPIYLGAGGPTAASMPAAIGYEYGAPINYGLSGINIDNVSQPVMWLNGTSTPVSVIDSNEFWKFNITRTDIPELPYYIIGSVEKYSPAYLANNYI